MQEEELANVIRERIERGFDPTLPEEGGGQVEILAKIQNPTLKHNQLMNKNNREQEVIRQEGGDISLRMAALNIDASANSFHGDYNACGECISELIGRSLFGGAGHPDFLTISEINSNKSLDYARQKVLDKYQGNFSYLPGAFTSRDKIAIIYDDTKWVPLYDERGVTRVTVSAIGKYIITGFENLNTKEHMYYCGVHMPHKSGKVRAYNLLREGLHEFTRQNFNVGVGGDFNAPPDQIATQLLTTNLGLSVGFTENDPHTTDKLGRKDNILFTSSHQDLHGKKVLHEEKAFTHYPISLTTVKK